MGVKVREKDGAWWIFVNHHGKRKAKRVGTKKAALEAAAKIQAKLTLGEFNMEEERKLPTFKELAGRWVSLPNDVWKDSTREDYASKLKVHVYPLLGKKAVDGITRRDLVDFFEAMTLKGLATATIEVIRAVVSGVLAYALDRELIPANPLSKIKVQGKAKENGEDDAGDFYTEEEAARLLAEAERYWGGEYYPPLLCALRTGMRIGEIEALQWGDVDFNSRFLDVRRSYRKCRLTDTKSRKRRRVDISAHLAETLKALQVLQKKRALQGGREISEWVFADEEGRMFHRTRMTNALNKCAEKAGLRRIRVHDLRHTYASVRLNKGHDIADVSRQLGHSDISITFKVYGHLIPGKHKSQVDDLDTVTEPAATLAQPSHVEARQY